MHHCGICGDTKTEARPAHLSRSDAALLPFTGDAYVCRKCATDLAADCLSSCFIPWVGFPCDECHTKAAFDGKIAGMPDGVVCDECEVDSTHDSLLPWDNPVDRGKWLCEPCFDKNHHGHRQKEIVPILDRLARIKLGDD